MFLISFYIIIKYIKKKKKKKKKKKFKKIKKKKKKKKKKKRMNFKTYDNEYELKILSFIHNF